MEALIGTPAPETTVDSWSRGAFQPVPLSLRDCAGRWVVLFFYPRDFTFVCPTELAAFADLAERFADEDAAVVAASTDSFHCHKAWYESDPRLASVAYSVVADTSHALATAFGVLLPDGAAMRATFVIDPAGIVRHVTLSDLNVGRSAEETLRVLQALRTGELCPASWRPGQPTLSVAA